MNKYLLMSAAALLAGTGAANAGTHSFVFGSQGGGSFCDGGTVVTGLSGGISDAWKHTNTNCSSGTSQGGGLFGKVEGLGRVFELSDNYEAKSGIYNVVTYYTLNKRLTMWTMWTCYSATTCIENNNGPLKHVTAGADAAKGNSTTSTAAKVAELVAASRRQVGPILPSSR